MIIVLIVILALALIVGLYITFPLIKICGNSMYPTLKDGEFHIGFRPFCKKKLIIGAFYVYHPPYEDGRYVIKRLVSLYHVGDKDYCYFLGDNPNESYDSSNYGYVSSDKIVARLILRKGGVKNNGV